LSSSNQLNTLRIRNKAAVPIVTPITEIQEIQVMALVDFFANKYRLAMKNSVRILL